MAYSRWIDSKFYTYWVYRNNISQKEDEIFIVHHNIESFEEFKYSECKKMIDSKLTLKGKMNFVDDDKEAEELQGYMKQFIKDVDHKYLTEIRGGQ